MVDGRLLTSEGIEVNLYALTENLIDKLAKLSRENNIILTITSGGILTQKPEPYDIQLSHSSREIEIYAQNKVSL